MTRSNSSLPFVLPVFLGIVFLGSELLSGLFQDRRSAEMLQVHVAQIDVIGDLVHDLQRERGLSSGVLASEARSLTSQLGAQRLRTDRAAAVLRQSWDLNNLSERQTAILGSLLQVRALRQGTDGQQISSTQAVEGYTGVVNQLLAASIVTPHSVTAQTRLSFLTNALQEVSLAKEAAGLQRATGAAILAGPTAAPSLFDDFIAFGAQERAFLELAAIHLRESRDLAFLDQTQVDHGVAVMRRDVLASRDAIPGDAVILPEDWFATSTDWINALRIIERDLQSVINDTAAQVGDEVRTDLVFHGLTVGLALLVLAFQLLMSPTAGRRRADHDGIDPVTAA